MGVTLHRGAQASHCRGLSLPSTGSRCAGSVIVAHGPSCSAACGIFPDQGSNPRPLHWQADSQPLRHQGSPEGQLLNPFGGARHASHVHSTPLMFTAPCLSLRPSPAPGPRLYAFPLVPFLLLLDCPPRSFHHLLS